MHLTNNRMVRSIAVCLGFFFVLAANAQPVSPSTTDAWDLSQGATITASSPTLVASGGSDAAALLGGTLASGAEPDNLIFGDTELAGFTHFVEFSTTTGNIVALVLNARHDSLSGTSFDANERGFSEFRLLARSTGSPTFDQLVFSYNPANPYGDSVAPAGGFVGSNDPASLLSLCVNISPPGATEYRVEFDQFGDRTPLGRGPRIIELDAYETSPCPATPAPAPGPGDATPIPTVPHLVLLLLALVISGAGLAVIRRAS